MRGAVQLAATLVAALATGCTTIVDVTYDDAQDFSGYRTWSWLPRGVKVSALPGEERGLQALTSRLVAQELEDLGLERVAAGADLLVGYELRVRRRLVVVNETGASDLLSSHHASPSYLVQATVRRVHAYDHGYLQLVVTDGCREQLLWRGELWGRHRGDFARHVQGSVERLLEDLPVGNLPRGRDASGTVGARAEQEPAGARQRGCSARRDAAAARAGARTEQR